MDSLEKVVENIKSVKIQGAKEIALYALKFLRNFCKKNGFKLKFEVATMILERSRPTAVVLHNCIEILMKKRSLKTIDDLIKRLETSAERISRNGRDLIKNNYTIMTHCHSGEAMTVIKRAWKDGKKVSVIATLTKPLDQGIRTVKELAQEKIPVTLIIDNAVGYFMKDVDIVLVGTDAIRLAPPYGIVNKIGTLNLALAAKKYKKPFYVVGNTLKVDKRKKIVIEERPSSEVYKNLKGVKIRNPAFDIIAFNLIEYIITEKGIFTPSRFQKIFSS